MPGNLKISQVSLTTHILCGLYTYRDRLDIAIASVQCSNHVPAVATLIEIGAECNQGNKNKWTPSRGRQQRTRGSWESALGGSVSQVRQSTQQEWKWGGGGGGDRAVGKTMFDNQEFGQV